MSDETPQQINTNVAHPARVYDYWLGGKDNFPADREAAKQAIAALPSIIPSARANRAFLRRVVHHLAAEAGIRQFLDIGTGLPTNPNVHEVAQAAIPDARIVYVDNDPIVLVHARALLTSRPEGVTTYLDADLRDPDAILRAAAATLDFTQPVAVLLVAILQFVGPDEDAHGIVARLVDALPPGSYLAMSHPAKDIDPEAIAEFVKKMNRMASVEYTMRTVDEVARFFDGLELVEPGMTQIHRWHPDDPTTDLTREFPMHAAVARKP